MNKFKLGTFLVSTAVSYLIVRKRQMKKIDEASANFVEAFNQRSEDIKEFNNRTVMSKYVKVDLLSKEDVAQFNRLNRH